MAFEILSIQQGSEIWHQSRSEKINASEVASILGMSKWKTADNLYLEKTLGIKEEISFEKQQLFDKGHLKEKIARELYEGIMKEKYPPAVIRNDKYPFAQASLDCLSSSGKVAEIKYLGVDPFLNLFLNQKVPIHYLPQLQFQICLAEVDQLTFIGINEFDQIAYAQVPRDENFITDMMLKAEMFWEKVKNAR